ncbi:MAG: hydroxylamine oxidase, partial [Thermodesulfobacteriota bacterium]|nr:hydroxylamine oxidase [Thermodesulfobacteriota bacterium]
MRSMVKVAGYVVVLMFVSVQVAMGAGPPVSEATEACLGCHRSLNPGIVADWEKGRMARVTPRVAKSMILKKRRVSFDTLPDHMAGEVVGCAECHTMHP